MKSEKILGRYLRDVRKVCGLRSVSAAVESGLAINQKTLYAYEAGTIGIELNRLIEILGFYTGYAKERVERNSAEAYQILGAASAVLYWGAVVHGLNNLIPVLKDLLTFSVLPQLNMFVEMLDGLEEQSEQETS